MADQELPPHELGRRGEKAALSYLRRQGFQILEQSYRFGRGEIDLIAYEGDTLVFIEVKTRFASTHSTPEEAVTPLKQKQIRRIAQAYLYAKRLEDIPCRFDVMALQYATDSGFRIRHYRDAFE
jgi:putative endonuclease